MSEQRLKLAVFIDFDNVEIGVKTTLGRQFDVGAVLEAVKERGEIITKIAYGDWKRAGDHGRAMAQHAVRLVQRVMTPGGDKNGADINLALDALEMAFTHDHINAFVIVGGDSDFITLVEKLKQYDKKVFVIGGRSFTSQVMQKNCTEFIAYENVTSSSAPVSTSTQPDRHRVQRMDRGRTGGGAPLDQALPLVQRALKVLADREVSPQLGLLKSTLLQLDSSFSERDYGASTFRDFAEKLEQRGLVALKHSGRTTVVELIDTPDVAREAVDAPRDAGEVRVDGVVAMPGDVDGAEGPRPVAPAVVPELSLADGVALVRQVLAEATTPPRWPMYLRQMKQFLRTARPDFDERRYGSLQDLLRACQKDGLVRLERDRQGGLRAFAGATKPTNVPHGWASLTSPEGEPAVEAEAGNVLEMEPERDIVEAAPVAELETPPPAPIRDEEPDAVPEGVDPEDDQLAMFGVVAPDDPDPVPKRARKSRKTGEHASGDRPKRGRSPGGAGRKPPASRTRSRRNQS
jgi:uncharacterized LabA/DUF88 family protein